MKRNFLFLFSFFLIFFSLNFNLQAIASTIHVDTATGNDSNDGSAASPVATIQKGVDLLPGAGGTVLVQPGTYIGPILVDRDDVIIRGDTTPQFDGEGFLNGFTQEVVITITEPLFDPGSLEEEAEDVIELRGSNNEVHNVVVDVPAGLADPGGFVSGFSAKAEDSDFYDAVVFRNILERGEIGSAGWSRKANVLFENITALDGGFVGINPTANGDVEVKNVNLANWFFASVCYIGLSEYPAGDNGPSTLTGEIKDSKFTGFSLYGLLLIGQNQATNLDASVTIAVEAKNNTFLFNLFGIRVQPVFLSNGFVPNTGVRSISLEVKDNTYAASIIGNVSVNFRQLFDPFDFAGPFGFFSTVSVEDKDGFFPDPAGVDLGPSANGNVYIIKE